MSQFISADLIPPQKEGAHSDTHAEKQLADEDVAKSFFKKVCDRAININDWNKYSGELSANFTLCDKSGDEVDRTVRMFDHFKINVPGPGTVAGKGYDWVQVEAFEKFEAPKEEVLLIRVRPVSNPTEEKQDTAHFFTESSTSSFIIKRVNNTVSAEVHGRNEKLNTEASNVLDKARNALAGAAAVMGFSKFQWKTLTEGLINYAG